jgi:hypothetical protein
MKFLSLTLAGLLATANAGRAQTKAALHKVRHLQDDGNYDGENEYVEAESNGDVEVFGVTSNNKLQFNQCITVTIQSGNLMMDNLVDYTKAGTLTAIRNYIIFDMCDKSEGCKRDKSAPFDSTYMVDLPTFMFAAIEEGFAESEDYCEACVTFGSECGFEGFEEGDNRRNLEYATIDCDKCKALGCYQAQDGNQNANYQQGNALNWAEAIASCYPTGTYWEGILLYAGWTCNAEGTGVQAGIFLDQTCRMYHNGLSYANIMSAYDYWTMIKTKNAIPAMFSTSIDCDEGSEEKTYVSKEEYSAVEKTFTEGEANAACQAIFNGYYFLARPLSHCGEITDFSNLTANYANYDQDWYSYELSRTDLFDQATICEHIKSKYSSNKPLKSNIFSAEGSGAYYNYTQTSGLFGDLGSGSSWWRSGKNNRGGKTNNWWGNDNKESNKMSPAGIFFLVIFALGVAGVAMVRLRFGTWIRPSLALFSCSVLNLRYILFLVHFNSTSPQRRSSRRSRSARKRKRPPSLATPRRPL